MSDQTTVYTIDESDAGTRLDVYLAKKLKLGRAEIKRLLGRGEILLNARKTTEKDKGLLLYSGSKVTVGVVEANATAAVVPDAEMELRVLKEGDGWVAVDKPAGIPVHPLEMGETGTLLNGLVARFPQIQGLGEGGLRSGVVHRLDTDTSGVILFATDQSMWNRLRQAFEKHETRKVYRAIVEGEMTGRGAERMPLVVARHRPAKVEVTEPDHPKARMCDLTWRAMEELNGATLLEIDLGTGFLHQIRVMMAELGHPVVGDTVYGAAMRTEAIRQMLHASFIRAAGAEAQSPDPEDFQKLLAELRA